MQLEQRINRSPSVDVFERAQCVRARRSPSCAIGRALAHAPASPVEIRIIHFLQRTGESDARRVSLPGEPAALRLQRRLRAAGLLQHVRQFVGKQAPTLALRRSILLCIENDVVSERERVGATDRAAAAATGPSWIRTAPRSWPKPCSMKVRTCGSSAAGEESASPKIRRRGGGARAARVHASQPGQFRRRRVRPPHDGGGCRHDSVRPRDPPAVQTDLSARSCAGPMRRRPDGNAGNCRRRGRMPCAAACPRSASGKSAECSACVRRRSRATDRAKPRPAARGGRRPLVRCRHREPALCAEQAVPANESERSLSRSWALRALHCHRHSGGGLELGDRG